MALCLMNGRCQPAEQRKLGGSRAAIFVYVMWGLDIMAFLANAGSLITYFTGFINFGLAKSATTQTNYMGTAFLLALLGGYLSDTYISRFTMCVMGGSIQVLGYVVLTIQARYDSLRPTPCKGLAAFNSEQCEHASSGQLAILYIGLYVVALGVSCNRAGLPPLGADQFDETDHKGISSFFNWFLFSLTTGAIIGLTLVVWISANHGWAWGFGVCAIALFIGTVVIVSGKPFYRINKPDGNSPIVRILQVFTAAARNWRLPVPEESSMLHVSEDKEVGDGVQVLTRTDQFRFLDKAAIIKSAHSSPSSHVSGPWHICTVTQIEETKIILRMIPIIVSTIFMNTCLAQLQTFSVQQGVTMDPNLFGLKVPAASLPVIPFLFMIFLVPIYDKIFVPVTRRFTGIPTGITQLQRIGVGLVLSVISMAIAAVIEIRRKHVAIEHNMVDSFTPLPISAFWLAPQYAIFGAADLFTLAGLLEFFYAESSLGMKSLGTSISWCSLALGYFLSSVVVEVVNKASGGWLASNNLNRGKLNNFYWLLAGLSVVNFGFYLLCATWYTYKKVEVKQLDTSNVTPLDISDGEELQPIGKR